MTSLPNNGATPGEMIELSLNKAITQAMVEFDKSFVVKWITIVEVMQDDGERGVWTFSSAGLTRWDSQGLLVEAIDRERGDHMAHIVVDHLKE